MALTPSKMIALGSSAPLFKGIDTLSNTTVELRTLQGRTGTLVIFLCNHCPYVKHINPELARLSRDYEGSDISIIGISSNDIKKYPEDGPAEMKKHAEREAYRFPYIFDQDQSIARSYDAACTPDFYLYNSELKLVYRGQFDSSRPGNGILPSGKDLREAIELLRVGKEFPASAQKPSMGCNIKWVES